MKILNYGGVEMSVDALKSLATSLETDAARKRERASRPTLFDEPMPRSLHDSYVQQAVDRENEAQAIRRFVARHSQSLLGVIHPQE